MLRAEFGFLPLCQTRADATRFGSVVRLPVGEFRRGARELGKVHHRRVGVRFKGSSHMQPAGARIWNRKRDRKGESSTVFYQEPPGSRAALV